MATERLLQFISRLQGEREIARGRQMVLAFVRENCGAQLAALYLLDPRVRAFELLAASGQPPASSPSSRSANAHSQGTALPERIPGDGLFAAALKSDELLYITDLASDPLSEERHRDGFGGPLVLSRVSAGTQAGKPQGLLVLAFAPRKNTRDVQGGRHLLSAEGEADLRVCIALLSAYLTRDESAVHERHGQAVREANTSVPALRQKPCAAVPSPEAGDTLVMQDVQQSISPETMYSITALAELYQVGLAVGSDLPISELYQQMLSHLRSVVRARGACLLVYQPVKQRFIVGAMQGEALPCSTLLSSLRSSEIERLAMRGPGETLTSLMVAGQLLLLVTLSYNATLLALAVLSIDRANMLMGQRAVLLSYMGRVAGVILRNHELRIKEQKDVVDQERNRIARDLHDGVAQQLALLLLKIEYIQRLLEQSPQQLPTALQELKRTYTLLKGSVHDLRCGISSMKPAQLEQQGVEVALQSLVAEFKLNTPGSEISSTLVGLDKLPEKLEVPLYRLVQEALHNISKHALASRVTVQIRVLPRLVVVEISDNGRGFQPEQIGAAHSPGSAAQHMGLRSMRERVQEVGGSWEIQSRPGAGTTIRARFPLAAPSMRLTRREREVLQLIIEGLTNRDIAARLSISVETVKSHTHHIMQKMQVKDRTQAAVAATRQGLL